MSKKVARKLPTKTMLVAVEAGAHALRRQSEAFENR